jgi:hypothetical protein
MVVVSDIKKQKQEISQAQREKDGLVAHAGSMKESTASEDLIVTRLDGDVDQKQSSVDNLRGQHDSVVATVSELKQEALPALASTIDELTSSAKAEVRLHLNCVAA